MQVLTFRFLKKHQGVSYQEKLKLSLFYNSALVLDRVLVVGVRHFAVGDFFLSLSII